MGTFTAGAVRFDVQADNGAELFVESAGDDRVVRPTYLLHPRRNNAFHYGSVEAALLDVLCKRYESAPGILQLCKSSVVLNSGQAHGLQFRPRRLFHQYAAQVVRYGLPLVDCHHVEAGREAVQRANHVPGDFVQP